MRLELPNVVNGLLHTWTESDCKSVLDSIKFLIGGYANMSHCVPIYKFERKQNLYYADSFSYYLTLYFDYKKFYTKARNVLKTPITVKTLIVDENGKQYLSRQI